MCVALIGNIILFTALKVFDILTQYVFLISSNLASPFSLSIIFFQHLLNSFVIYIILFLALSFLFNSLAL